MCSSLHALCYERMRSCAIHDSFALYDGGVFPACHPNKAGCQWTEALSNLITQNRCSFPVFESGENPILKCFCLTTSFVTLFYLWSKLRLKNGTILFAFKTFLRKLKDACLFKSVLWQETWNLLGLMDNKRKVFVFNRRFRF